MAKHKFVELLMSTTGDAYSRDRYGEEAWEKAIILLLTFGFGVEACYEILMSKYMRWAAEQFGKHLPSGDIECTGEEIIMYHRKHEIDIKELMAELPRLV